MESKPKPRRRWFRYHLSTAILLMIAAAVVLGVYIQYQHYYDEGEVNRRRLREELEKKVSANFEGTPFSEALQFLRSYSRISTLISPKLVSKDGSIDLKNITLKIDNLAVKDALSQACKSAGADWCICSGVILVYPAGEPPTTPNVPPSSEAWQRDILRKLKRRVTFCFVDTPLTEGVQFFGQLTQVRITFDPKFHNPDENLVSGINVVDVSLEDALTWTCFLADAEWTLKMTDDGVGTVWISHRAQK